jgi:hypothetical protein
LSCGKWERRKGWELLLEAYLAEFKAEEEVELYIITKPYAGSGNKFKSKLLKWIRRAVLHEAVPAAAGGEGQLVHGGPVGAVAGEGVYSSCLGVMGAK